MLDITLNRELFTCISLIHSLSLSNKDFSIPWNDILSSYKVISNKDILIINGLHYKFLFIAELSNKEIEGTG